MNDCDLCALINSATSISRSLDMPDRLRQAAVNFLCNLFENTVVDDDSGVEAEDDGE